MSRAQLHARQTERKPHVEEGRERRREDLGLWWCATSVLLLLLVAAASWSISCTVSRGKTPTRPSCVTPAHHLGFFWMM